MTEAARRSLAALASLTDDALAETMTDPFGNDTTRAGLLALLAALIIDRIDAPLGRSPGNFRTIQGPRRSGAGLLP